MDVSCSNQTGVLSNNPFLAPPRELQTLQLSQNQVRSNEKKNKPLRLLSKNSLKSTVTEVVGPGGSRAGWGTVTPVP